MRRRGKEVRRMKKGVQVEKGGASGAERPSSSPTLSFSGELGSLVPVPSLPRLASPRGSLAIHPVYRKRRS
jgi:hypothetical protein